MTAELARRIAFTLGGLLVFRLGTYIPIPGIAPDALHRIISQHHDGLPGLADAATGGAIQRVSIFSLGIAPYLSAAIILQLLALVIPRFHARSRCGESGRRAMVRYTVGLAILLALLQAYGISLALQNADGLVREPGPLFLLTTTVSLVGGAVFLIWLAEQMTLRGIGNGLALLLCVGILAKFVASIASTAELARLGLMSGAALLVLAALAVAGVALIVVMERARRILPLVFTHRPGGGAGLTPQRGHLALKLNGAGIIPAIAAAWLASIPIAIVGLIARPEQGWLAAALRFMQPGKPAHMVFTVVVVIIVALIYTAFVVDPEHAAESLRARGGAFPGIAPGEASTDHLDRVVTSTTLVGAAYLVLMLLMPEALIAYAKVPYYFGGASALIMVCVVLDIEAQVRGLVRTGRGTNAHEIDSSRTAGGG
ncbi:MAG TPA: preprotein translocase subunit SecY [Nitrobacter sp.]|nr:preprotein translocase subunit SecY [Nitrobacter sp.]